MSVFKLIVDMSIVSIVEVIKQLLIGGADMVPHFRLVSLFYSARQMGLSPEHMVMDLLRCLVYLILSQLEFMMPR